MKTSKNFLSSAKWIFEVSRRFAKIDRNGRSSATNILSTLGICFGVMTLVAVVSVMNGFQAFSINPIMEISSAHLRASEIPEAQVSDFLNFCAENPGVSSVSPFFESQGLIVGKNSKQAAAVVRAVSPDILNIDKGFGSQVKIVIGKFNLDSDGIVLGKALANQLGVTVGSAVNLLALAGGKDVALISQNRQFTVTGIFSCNYIDIEQSYSFVSLESAEKYFGKDSEPLFSIKLKNYEKDVEALSEIKVKFPEIKIQSWREFNKSFFGALRIEKNILMLLVCIIFVVVGINIYNGMRRLVFERRQEISILSALGGTESEIKSIFIMRGLTSGVAGSFLGLALGLLICVNIKPIFDFAGFLTQNYMFTVFAQIPAKIVFREVFFITLFGIASPLWAAWKASKNVLDLKVSEVLHDE